ncbi:MAG: carboxypeptidase regulatory-like domain-containing protein, partial [Blastocatellia bacterium]|nr:carboxypeptidase regulatory-like domain-containing protein [Blastocatellia bacterium]
MRRRVVVTLITLSALVFGATWTAMAQTATGQITGVVKDANGAVLAKAKVKVDNALTGLARETTTNEEGIYAFPLLPVGVYAVTVEHQGFHAAKKANISVNVDQIVRAEFDLTVGNVSDVVEVESGAAALDTETASIGQVVSQRQVTQLPLNGRNFLQLLFLNGGTVETGGEQGTMRQGAGNAISINGARPTSNNYLLDGTSNTDTTLGTPAAILSVDAIQEFKEQTGTYSAEYGFSANQVNIVSKRGTNDLHGTVFWFGRNDALDANNFFNNARGQEKTKLRQNQYGFVAGGPVRIPKLYDGRNKSFWLVNFEGYKRILGISDLLTVPTPDQFAGR